MKNDILKELALKAKNRLIHKSEKEPNGRSDYRIKIIKSEDDIFYNKVKSILDRNDEVINPIKELMGDLDLVSMSDSERERQLLETVDKYKKFKSLIEDEHQVKYGF